MLNKILVGFAVSVLLIVLGCSDSLHQRSLLVGLQQHKAQLTPVAELLIVAGDGAMIDFRDSPATFRPNVIAEQITDEQIVYFKQANIHFATYDSSFGAVLFEARGRGIGISGASSGYLYRHQLNSDIELVTDLQQAFDRKRAAQEHHSPLDIRMVQMVEGDWGIYLETF
ncbi:MAG: hypothetical protein AAFZ92_07840 [Pseudomonadota bacterium]